MYSNLITIFYLFFFPSGVFFTYCFLLFKNYFKLNYFTFLKIKLNYTTDLNFFEELQIVNSINFKNKKTLFFFKNKLTSGKKISVDYEDFTLNFSELVLQSNDLTYLNSRYSFFLMIVD